jgi:putative tricarboxylic transport membrane protein
VTASAPTEESAPARRSGRGDVVSGLVVAGAGVVLLVAARGIEDAVRPAAGVGPATLPTALSVLLIIAGLVLALIGWRGRERDAEARRDGVAETVDELVHHGEPDVPWRRLVVVVALFIGYALVFIPLGYMLATALYLGVMVTVIDRARWKRNLIFAVVFAVTVYFGFTELLGVQLPAGMLG